MNEITLNEIFKEKGFSNKELILTEGSLSPTGNFSQLLGLEDPTYNILIGIKDGVLSFFGGGHLGMLTIKNDAVTLNRKLSLTLSLIKSKKFSHLFDIPISNIAEIIPRQKEKSVVVLNIYEKSDKRIRLCFHAQLLNEINIAIANILMDAFERILGTENLSKGQLLK